MAGILCSVFQTRGSQWLTRGCRSDEWDLSSSGEELGGNRSSDRASDPPAHYQYRKREVAPIADKPGIGLGWGGCTELGGSDRKSTRLNCRHANISYAVFCL